jgi:Domain of unknown function (DUF4386)
MSSTHNPGTVAGLWYLLLIAIGPLVLIYIPNKLFVHGNPAATVNNIAAHERLFRIGILAELVGGVILIFLVLVLVRVDRPISCRALWADDEPAPTAAIIGFARPKSKSFTPGKYEE